MVVDDRLEKHRLKSLSAGLLSRSSSLLISNTANLYCLINRKGFVPLPKSDTPSRIKENFEVFDWSLSDEQMQTLDGLDQGPQGAISWNPVDAA